MTSNITTYSPDQAPVGVSYTVFFDRKPYMHDQGIVTDHQYEVVKSETGLFIACHFPFKPHYGKGSWWWFSHFENDSDDELLKGVRADQWYIADIKRKARNAKKSYDDVWVRRDIDHFQHTAASRLEALATRHRTDLLRLISLFNQVSMDDITPLQGPYLWQFTLPTPSVNTELVPTQPIQ